MADEAGGGEREESQSGMELDQGTVIARFH